MNNRNIFRINLPAGAEPEIKEIANDIQMIDTAYDLIEKQKESLIAMVFLPSQMDIR
jgi:hypothetical protein